MSEGQTIGTLLGEMKATREDIKTLFRSDENLKEKHSKSSGDIQLFAHTVEENSAIITGLVSSMEKFEERFDKNFNSMREDIHTLTTQYAVLESDVKEIKKRKFNWPMVMGSIGTLIFNFIELFKSAKFLLFVSLISFMIFAAHYPESVPLLKDLLESAPK